MRRLAAVVLATVALASSAALAAPQDETFIPEDARINVTHCFGPEPAEFVSSRGLVAAFVAAVCLALLLREALRKPGRRRGRPSAR
jgi:hypothetical protein